MSEKITLQNFIEAKVTSLNIWFIETNSPKAQTYSINNPVKEKKAAIPHKLEKKKIKKKKKT